MRYSFKNTKLGIVCNTERPQIIHLKSPVPGHVPGHVLAGFPPTTHTSVRGDSSHLLDDSFMGAVVLTEEDPTWKLGRVMLVESIK